MKEWFLVRLRCSCPQPRRCGTLTDEVYLATLEVTPAQAQAAHLESRALAEAYAECWVEHRCEDPRMRERVTIEHHPDPSPAVCERVMFDSSVIRGVLGAVGP